MLFWHANAKGFTCGALHQQALFHNRARPHRIISRGRFHVYIINVHKQKERAGVTDKACGATLTKELRKLRLLLREKVLRDGSRVHAFWFLSTTTSRNATRFPPHAYKAFVRHIDVFFGAGISRRSLPAEPTVPLREPANAPPVSAGSLTFQVRPPDKP